MVFLSEKTNSKIFLDQNVCHDKKKSGFFDQKFEFHDLEMDQNFFHDKNTVDFLVSKIELQNLEMDQNFCHDKKWIFLKKYLL